MFYLFWSVLVVMTLVVSLGVFIWACRSGQFSEQGRARYLPLRGSGPSPGEPHRPAKELYALLAIGAGVCVIFIYTLILVARKGA